MPICSSIFPALCCNTFKVSDLISRSLIHFELILVQGERPGSSFPSSKCGYPVFPATFVEEAVFSPLYILSAFVKIQVAIAVWIFIWGFYSVSLVFMSVFVTISCCFLLQRPVI
jgi:hypothetical protein